MSSVSRSFLCCFTRTAAVITAQMRFVPICNRLALNNTCVAPPRMLIAFLENHLQEDGTVTIPKVLQPYMGGKTVLVPKNK